MAIFLGESASVQGVATSLACGLSAMVSFHVALRMPNIGEQLRPELEIPYDAKYCSARPMDVYD